MGKQTKKLFNLLLALLLVLPALPLSSGQAAASTEQPITFGTKVTGTITETNTEQVYKITLEKAGTISVNLKSYIYYAYLDLLDAEGNPIWESKNINYGHPDDPEIRDYSADLEAGTYYLKVYKNSDNTGKYDLTVNYNPANNNEIESNNTIQQAQVLALSEEKVTGFISESDKVDYYKITLPEAGTVSVNFKSYIYYSYLSLLDANENPIWDGKNINYGYTDKPEIRDYSADLEAGTYYLKVYKSSDNTGKYDLTVKYNPANNNEKESNNTINQAQSLTLNAEKVTGFISESDKIDYYKITIPKAGTFSVNLKSYIYYAYLSLLDADENPIWDGKNINYGYTDKPEIRDYSADLEAGTYYLKFYKSSDNTGKYDLTVKYKPANNNEKESNNTLGQAQELVPNVQKVTGFISESDNIDYYKFTLPKSGTIKLNVNSYIYYSYIDLLNAEENPLWDGKNINYGYTDKPTPWDDSIYLKAGTYYVKVYKSSSNTGKYTLNVSAPFLLPAVPSVNTVSTNSTTVSGKTSPSSTVYLKLGQTTYKKNSDSNGYFKFTISKQKAGTKLYVYASNKYGTSSQKVVTVGAPASTPSVATISNNTTYVTGKTSKGNSVYVKIGSKTYKASVNSKGEFKLKISKQKAGAKLYITAKNAYGSSKSKVVTVVDRIAPSTPSVYSVTHKSKYVTGKAEAYSTVKAYVGSKRIGATKADKHGKYKIKISSRKNGTLIKVTAIDRSGNKSKYRTVRVK
ncbi:Ig-like domain-containing protein [Bacillus rubiinfantis]|uniref:Ig-like domain-containing protein n=1 Tax=Bacillus rubiinfantis TaxID=1499680 RepID=UPI0005A6C49E|nr:Ig-like domain-containing protein [Bacillus rubiinfantis]